MERERELMGRNVCLYRGSVHREGLGYLDCMDNLPTCLLCTHLCCMSTVCKVVTIIIFNF